MRSLVLTVAILFALVACQSTRHASGGPYYFKSFASHESPFRPVEEISHSEAESLQAQGYAFYAVWFNERGQVERYEKHYRGAIDSRAQYSYREGKLVEARGVDPDGKEIVQSFAK
jgi:hypothetical protein